MAYKVIILYRLYMPSYFLGTFTEYPYIIRKIPKSENQLRDFLYYLVCYRIREYHCWLKGFGLFKVH